MNLLKKLFSRLCYKTSQPTNENQQNNNDLLLKQATRDAVMKAFQNPDCSIEDQSQSNNFSRNTFQTKTKSDKRHFEKSDTQHSGSDSIDPKILKILHEYNEQFFKLFNITNNKYKVKIDKKNITTQIDNKEFESMLSTSDQLSSAYEYIFQRLVREQDKHFDYRLFLHAGNSNKNHHNYIKKIAKKNATKALQTNREVILTAKSSYERSLIHKVIEKIPGVKSKSIGLYHKRSLIIYPDLNHSHADK